jgi:hypothetical protein
MAAASTSVVEMTVTEERYAPYDDAHGTPHEMLRRVLTLRLAGGSARFEQTDYGHPGRLNAWEPRGIDGKLQPRTADLLAVCEALTPLLT